MGGDAGGRIHTPVGGRSMPLHCIFSRCSGVSERLTVGGDAMPWEEVFVNDLLALATSSAQWPLCL